VVRPRSPQRRPGLQFVGPAFAPHGPGGLDPEGLGPELGSSGGRAHYSPRPPSPPHHRHPLALVSCRGSPVHTLARLAAPGAAQEGRLRPLKLLLLDRPQSKVTMTPLEQNPPNKLLLRWLRVSCSVAAAVAVLLVLRFGPHTLCLPGWP